MEEKKQMKISFKIAIMIAVVIIILICIIGVGVFKETTEKNKYQNNYENNTEDFQSKIDTNSEIYYELIAENLTKYKNSKYPISNTVKMDESGDYYVIKNDYAGEYDIQYMNFSAESGKEIYEKLNNERTSKKILNYEEYEKFCEEWKINKKYSNKFKSFATIVNINDVSSIKVRLAGVGYYNNNVDLFVWEDTGSYRTEDWVGYTLIVPLDEKIENVHTKVVFSDRDVELLKELERMPTVAKPVIYLYPIDETVINVELKNKDKITCSYPKYKESWNVIAKPNGDLKETETGRDLYSLYYESKAVEAYKIEEEGFVVKGEDIAKFLEEKLDILGLNDREAEEFIIYWLPKLESNKYNYIRFATAEEIEKNMPLEITPKPDTKIRIIMTFKGLDKPIQVKEQKLEKVDRKGFVAVEWGGSEINTVE